MSVIFENGDERIDLDLVAAVNSVAPRVYARPQERAGDDESLWDMSLKALVEQKGITRMCHFTQSRNLAHIFGDGVGLCSTYDLKKERMPHNCNAPVRYDQREDLICCSIEYPNAYYFEHSRKRIANFTDWAVLLIDPKYIYHVDSIFCPSASRNKKGDDIGSGLEGFNSMYANHIKSSDIKRGKNHLEAVPTDIESEILVNGPIPLEDIIGVVFQSKEQAINEIQRLNLLKAPLKCKTYICSNFFQSAGLEDKIHDGLPCDFEEIELKQD